MIAKSRRLVWLRSWTGRSLLTWSSTATTSTGPDASSIWPRRWGPIGSSWPIPSTTAGPGVTAQPCCPAGLSLKGPRRWYAPRAAAQRGRGRWAGRSRAALLPSRAQLEGAEAVVRAARRHLEGKMEIIYVIPDYYSKYPKPCMGGWGQKQLTVTPNGNVLPCPAAHTLDLPQATVREHSLEWIWEESSLFQRFRGTEWMPDPCRSCDRRKVDFGGCRCQAFQLTGDAARTDPVCPLSPAPQAGAEAGRGANEGAERGEADLIPRVRTSG